MWIKICANTTLDDAQMAVDFGADAVGFVFAPSARRVSVEQAGAITARLVGAAERIGVFQSTDFDEIRRAVGVAGLNGVQLHGGYSPGLIGALRGEFAGAITIAQTLHWGVDVEEGVGRSLAATLLEQVRAMSGERKVDRVLIDAKVGAALGGTGRSFDWDAAAALFDQAGTTRMIVAGGLHPGNVGKAVETLRPWGVDVASGVETLPGRKDPERVRLFLAGARGLRGGSAAAHPADQTEAKHRGSSLRSK